MTINNFYIIYKFLRLKFWGFLFVFSGVFQIFGLSLLCQQIKMTTDNPMSTFQIMTSEFAFLFVLGVLSLGAGGVLSLMGTSKIEKHCEEETINQFREKKQEVVRRKKEPTENPVQSIQERKREIKKLNNEMEGVEKVINPKVKRPKENP